MILDDRYMVITLFLYKPLNKYIPSRGVYKNKVRDQRDITKTRNVKLKKSNFLPKIILFVWINPSEIKVLAQS